MNIALITPYYYPPIRGNAVTVRRIERQLDAAGLKVGVLSLDLLSASEMLSQIKQNPPDLLHAFHGYSGGRVAREISRQTGIPYLVTLTGSDVYEALEDERRQDTLEVLRHAEAVVTFDKCVKCRVVEHHPSLAAKTKVIPQGVELPGDDFAWGDAGFSKGEIVFFLPAGLRSVKNTIFPLGPLARLHREDPRIRFILAGPVLDEEYGADCLKAMDRCSFASYFGEVGYQAIGALYRRADVVLNSSLFEGGMANSVLEAMAFGRPVLASYIDGNRSIVKEGKTGLLYTGEAEFIRKGRQLIQDHKLRERLGQQGREYVTENFTPEREAVQYRELYESIGRRGVRGIPPFPGTPAPSA